MSTRGCQSQSDGASGNLFLRPEDCGILRTTQTELSKKLGVEHAVFGFTPFPAVAAAISRAGGFGVLTPEVVDAVDPLPVLAAGGIGSGQQVAAALTLGAQGVWLGSLWLTTTEAELPSPKLIEKLLAAGSGDTVRSRALTGKPARQLRTGWTDAWDDPNGPGTLPMPLQGLLVAEAVSRIQKYEVEPLLGTPVGQIVGRMNSERSVQAVFDDLTRGFEKAVDRLNRIAGRSVAP